MIPNRYRPCGNIDHEHLGWRLEWYGSAGMPVIFHDSNRVHKRRIWHAQENEAAK